MLNDAVLKCGLREQDWWQSRQSSRHQFRRRLYSYRSHSPRSRGAIEEPAAERRPSLPPGNDSWISAGSLCSGEPSAAGIFSPAHGHLWFSAQPRARSQSNAMTNMMSGPGETRANVPRGPIGQSGSTVRKQFHLKLIEDDRPTRTSLILVPLVICSVCRVQRNSKLIFPSLAFTRGTSTVASEYEDQWI